MSNPTVLPSVHPPDPSTLPSTRNRSLALVMGFVAMLSGGAVLGRAHAQISDPVGLAALDLSSEDPVASNPYGLALHPTAPTAFVALSGEPTFGDPATANGSTVVEVDLESWTVLRSFEVGFFPTDLVISSDGAELFVVSSTASTLSRIVLATGDVTTVPIVDTMGGTVGFPTGIQFSPDESLLFISSNGGGFDGSQENLVVIDRATLTTSDGVEIVGGLGRFSVLSDGRVVVPVGFPDDVFPSNPQVRVYDSTNGWTELGSVQLTVDLADFPAPFDIAVSADELTAFVTVLGGSSEVFVVDLDAVALEPSLDLPFLDFAQSGLALEEEVLLVGDFEQSQVRGFDRTTGELVWTLPTGGGANSLMVGGGRLWVTDQTGVSLSAIALPGSYRRGDANNDGSTDVADGVQILSALFTGGSLSCQQAADVNTDGQLDLSDPVFLFQFIFSGGESPAYPRALPGREIVPSGLPCGL